MQILYEKHIEIVSETCRVVTKIWYLFGLSLLDSKQQKCTGNDYTLLEQSIVIDLGRQREKKVPNVLITYI